MQAYKPAFIPTHNVALANTLSEMQAAVSSANAFIISSSTLLAVVPHPEPQRKETKSALHRICRNNKSLLPHKYKLLLLLDETSKSACRKGEASDLSLMVESTRTQKTSQRA